MITIIIIAITVIASLLAFYNRDIFSKLLFNPYSIYHHNQWYRFFSYSLIHANWPHLIINMFVLLSFGRAVEYAMQAYFSDKGILYYMLLYVGGIIFSVLFDFGRHKDNVYYNAVGASGAVSAVVFSSILFNPLGKIYFYFIPIGIPAVIFGILYLIYSAYMTKRGKDNVGHSAHFWGAIFGFAFTILLKPVLFMHFLEQIFGG